MADHVGRGRVRGAEARNRHHRAASEDNLRRAVSRIGEPMSRLSAKLAAMVADYRPPRGERTGIKGAADRAEARAQGKSAAASAV